MAVNFYIKVDESGNAVGHPYLVENLKDHFPNGIPEEKYQPFVRVSRPIPGVFENINDQPTYQKIDGIWQDVWDITLKTDVEINAIKANIDEQFAFVKNLRIEKVNALLADLSTTDAQKNVYNNYLAQIQTFTIKDYNNWSVPTVPKLDHNGNIIL